MNPQRVCAVVVVLSLATASCGGGDRGDGGGATGPGNGNGNASAAIDVRDNWFSPAVATVATGTTVTWTWRGEAQHDVVFANGARSPLQSTGTFARAFAAAGTFDYQCSIHGASMSGRVVVQ